MIREVRFNQAVNQDDGLLANSYARKYSLKFNEARSLLESDIKELIRLLHEEKEVTIGRLGFLIQGNENTLHFSPFYTSYQLSRELGFVSFHNTRKAPVRDNSNKKIETDPSKLDFNRNYYIPINKLFVKVAASLLIVIIVAVSALIPSSNREVEDQASVVPVQNFLKYKVNKSNYSPTKNIAATDNAIKQSSHRISDNGDSKKHRNELISGKRFYLIVGTFSSENEAMRFISTNQEKGYHLTAVPSKTLCRVAAMASDNKSELITELNSKTFKALYNEAWIWENKGNNR